MLYGGGLAGLAALCLAVYSFLDVIRTPATAVRSLPKPVWLILCFVPPLLGPLAWLLLGRPPHTPTRAGGPPRRGTGSGFPEYDRPGRAVAPNPDDDEAFLRALRERAEEQRRKAKGEPGEDGEASPT